MDAEPPHDRPPRDLGLELLGHAVFDESALAGGAGVGQGRLVALADLFGRGRRPMAVRAVGIAGLASGGLGLGPGRAFAEGCGLALAGADGFLELPSQGRDLGLQGSDLLEEFATSGTRGLVHAPMLAGRDGFSCANPWRQKSER
jgi:hypothetical protein